MVRSHPHNTNRDLPGAALNRSRIFLLLGLICALIASCWGYLQTHEIFSRLGATRHHQWHDVVQIGLGCVAALMLALIVIKLLDWFLWQAVYKRTGVPTPQLLVELARLMVFLVIAVVFLTVLLDVNLTGLLVSSGAVGIVVGLALQHMIRDFFSGLAISVEGPYRVGEWISVGEFTGKVALINWRATHLVTLEDTTIVIPNSYLAENQVTNFEMPDGYFRTELPVAVEYSVPVVEATRVLLAAVKRAPGVRTYPEPDVVLDKLGNDGLEYRVRWYITSYQQMVAMRSEVARCVTEALWQAGMNVPYPKRDVYFARMPDRDVDRKTQRDLLLARVPLFESLGAAELKQLADGLVERRVAQGQAVVSQGEQGTSMFVVVDGLFDVKITAHNREKTVAQLGPGDFFGEMSLLTGETRSATITAAAAGTVFELSHEHLAPVLQQRPAIADQLSHVIVQRRTRTQNLADQAGPQVPADDQQQSLLRRMRRFFHLPL